MNPRKAITIGVPLVAVAVVVSTILAISFRSARAEADDYVKRNNDQFVRNNGTATLHPDTYLPCWRFGYDTQAFTATPCYVWVSPTGTISKAQFCEGTRRKQRREWAVAAKLMSSAAAIAAEEIWIRVNRRSLPPDVSRHRRRT